MIKRIIVFSVLAGLLLCQSVFAVPKTQEEIESRYLSDLVDMERVFKYDYGIENSPDAGGEVLKYSDAVNVVLNLGILQRTDDGTFNEDGGVPFSEFAKIIVRLAAGDTSFFDEGYDRYPASKYATQNEAAHYILMALGYDAYVRDSDAQWPLNSRAKQIGILDKIDFSGEKNITRGELAQMIYNAFDVDMVVQTVIADNYGKYDKVKGMSLLEERFNSFIVEGTLTGQNGVNIYTSQEIDEDRIEIDRVSYALNGLKLDDMLGHRVIAVVQDVGNGYYTVSGVFLSQYDKTITIDLENISYISKENLFYNENNEEKDINLGAIERFILNGHHEQLSELDTSLLTCEGEIRLCTEEKNGDYDTAVVQSYQTFVIGGIANYSKKIVLQNGMKYDGESYIRTDDKEIKVFLDGEEADFSALKTGQVISVVENPAKTSLVLRASSKAINGNITMITDDEVYIDDKPYKLSNAYEKIRNSDSTVHSISMGYSGSFLLDYNGNVVRFARDTGSHIFGYLVGIERKKEALDSYTMLRIYSVNNSFEILTLAEKLTFDGREKVTAESAYLKLLEEESTVCDNPIRYRLNSKGEVIFLDTMISSSYESGDSHQMRLSYIFSGSLNWTVTASGGTSLPGTSFNWNRSTQNFVVPSDKTEEKEFLYRSSPDYEWHQEVTLKLYNADGYDTASLIVEDTDLDGSDKFTKEYRYCLVLGLLEGLNDDGEQVTMLELMDGTTAGTIPAKKFYVDEEITAKVKDLKAGDIIQIAGKGSNTVSDFKFIASKDDFHNLPKDMSNDPYGDRGEVLGTVEAVDAASGRIRIRTTITENGEEITRYYTFRRQSSAIYERSSGKNQDVTLADIEVGDRVFCFGGVQLMRLIVVR